MDAHIAYFDNAATTFPKPNSVYEFADSFYRTYGGNIGRSSNPMSMKALDIAQQAKENLREINHCASRKVVFTATATEALNRIIFGLDLPEGFNAYITPFEHNAVTRPLNHLVAEKKAHLHVLSFNASTLLPEMDAIRAAFKSDEPDLLIMTHASNVCGAIVPVIEIADMAKKYGAKVVVDMSQTAGLVPLDLSTRLIDYAVFAGHKTLYAPYGIGGFMCLDDSRLNPVLFGGNGINSVEQTMPTEIVKMSEIGSQNVYSIAGLAAATKWNLEIGIDELARQENDNRNALIGILREFNNIRIIGSTRKSDSVGVVSTLFKGYSPDEIEMVMDRNNIAIRSGIHCAPYAHTFLHTLPGGTVRFSVSALTPKKDFDSLYSVLKIIKTEG